MEPRVSSLTTFKKFPVFLEKNDYTVVCKKWWGIKKAAAHYTKNNERQLAFLDIKWFFIFAKNILSIFGQDFQIAQRALILLTIGYLVDSGFGLSIITLMMTGYERVVAGYQIIFSILFENKWIY